jgi:GH25 family lysozyme M1 (1,4-beta-N-acetylmuramidase)
MTKNKAYEFIINKFRAKLRTVKANKLNHARWLTYIKSVLASIPVYYMSTVLFSKTFVGKINAIITRFWWASVQDDNPTNPIAFRSWDDICQPKENGGLGIRDLYTVNKSLLTQAAWNIVTNKNPFLISVLKAKYYHNTSFWTANTTGPRSIFWSSIF